MRKSLTKNSCQPKITTLRRILPDIFVSDSEKRIWKELPKNDLGTVAMSSVSHHRCRVMPTKTGFAFLIVLPFPSCPLHQTTVRNINITKKEKFRQIALRVVAAEGENVSLSIHCLR